MDITPIFVVGFVFGTISWIAYVLLEAVRSRQRIHATSALQGKLIDRLVGALPKQAIAERLTKAL